jgi:Flp pilus assembly pilin Flp
MLGFDSRISIVLASRLGSLCTGLFALCSNLWRDDAGAEFVEWVVVVSLVVIVGILIYNQILTGALIDLLTASGNRLNS